MPTFETKLRPRYRLTLPSAVASHLDAHPGHHVIFDLDPDHPGVARMRVIRASYAGILAGVYGTTEERAAYLAEERASWEVTESNESEASGIG